MDIYLGAGLYWQSESPQVSFRRVCQVLIQQGMTTVNYGAFAAPDEALLTDLEQPDANLRGASFITSSKKRPVVRQTHRPPGKLSVAYGLLSDSAMQRGDHPAIQVSWSGNSFSGPAGYIPPRDAPVKGLQAYRFFTQLCTQLDPLYGALEVEREVPCLYDVLHPKVSASYSYLPLSEFYCRQGILGEGEEAFWQTYAYSEQLLHGTYGSDYPFFNPRRRGLGGDPEQRSQIWAERRTLLTQALKRFSRSRPTE